MPLYVNKERVADDMLQQELQMLLQRYRQEMTSKEMEQREEDIREDAKQNAIEKLILIQKAREDIDEIPPEEIDRRYGELLEQHGGEEGLRQRIDLTEEVEQEIKESVKDDCKLEQYFEKLTADIGAPDEGECRKYYEENTASFEYPEMLRASHIVRQPVEGQPPELLMAEMMNTREALLKGGDFAVMANEHSQCDDDGGDLGWFPRGQMVPEFEDVVFNMEPGEISDVFQTPFGFHIVKLLDKRESGCRDFEDVRYEIENSIIEARKNEVIGQAVDNLRESAVIEETADEKLEKTK